MGLRKGLEAPRFALLYGAVMPVLELSPARCVSTRNPACNAGQATKFSLLCGRSVSPIASPERLSSSSLPPSFAPGRRTAVFTPTGTAHRGARFHFSGALQ